MKILRPEELRAMSTNKLNDCYHQIKKELEHYQAKTHYYYDERIAEYDDKMNFAKTQEECHEYYIQLIYWMARKLNDAVVEYLANINVLDYINLIK